MKLYHSTVSLKSLIEIRSEKNEYHRNILKIFKKTIVEVYDSSKI